MKTFIDILVSIIVSTIICCLGYVIYILLPPEVEWYRFIWAVFIGFCVFLFDFWYYRKMY